MSVSRVFNTYLTIALNSANLNIHITKKGLIGINQFKVKCTDEGYFIVGCNDSCAPYQLTSCEDIILLFSENNRALVDKLEFIR